LFYRRPLVRRLTDFALRVLIVCLLALSSPQVVRAQEGTSAQDLFHQGIQLYTDGEYQKAQQTFYRLDPLQLDKKQRVKMYETIMEIDRRLHQIDDPADLLKQANDATEAGQLSQATKLYEAVIQHPRADTEQVRIATAKLDQTKRQRDASLSQARQSIDEAQADIESGRLDEAERKLRSIKSNGLDLGWFDNQRIDHQLIVIAQHRANPGLAATPGLSTQYSAPSGDSALAPDPVTVAPPPADAQPLTVETDPEILALRQALADARLQAQTARQAQAQAQADAQRQAQAAQQAINLEAQKQSQAQAQAQARQQVQAQQETQALQQAIAEAQRQTQLARATAAQALQEAQAARVAEAQALRQAQDASEVQAQAQAQAQARQQTQAQQETQALQQAIADAQHQAQLARETAAQALQEAQTARESEAQALRQAQAVSEEQAQAQAQARQRAQAQQETQALREALAQAQREAEQASAEAEKAIQQAQTARQAQVQATSAQGQLTNETPGVTAQIGSAQAISQPAPDDLLAQARLLRAQEKLAQGFTAEQANQYNLALERFQEAHALDPNHPDILTALTRVQAKADDKMQPAHGILETELENRTLRTQATIAEFEHLISRAMSLMDARNFTAARETIQQAKIILDLNQRLLPASVYHSRRERAVNLAAEVADAQRIAVAEETRQQELTRKQEAQQRRAAALQAQKQEVDRLLQQSADLRREQKYSQALELLSQSLFLDPTNIAALAMKEMIEDSQIYVQTRDQLRQRGLTMAHQSNANLEATIPYSDLMTYPADWPQLTAARITGRDQNSRESESNRRVARKLKEPIPINFESNDLKSVVEYFRNITGLNFFVNWPAIAAMGVEQDLPINLLLSNVPAEQALRMVLQQASAGNELEPIGFSIIEGVVTISTQRDLSKTTDIRSYDIRDLLVQVPNFTDAPEFDLDSALSNTSTGGSQGSGGGGGIFDEDTEDTEEALTRDQLIEQISTLIQDTVGKQEEWASFGGDVSSLRELNGNLIVRSTPENHRQIAGLLSQLRETRALQIAVESRFLVVNQNFLEEVGVDLDVQFNDVGSNFGPINIDQDSSSIAQRSGTSLTPSIFTNLDAVGNLARSFDFGLTYLDDLEVNLMIRATQASQRAITLTAPRLTLFNGQRAYVVVARQITFISDLEPIPDSPGFDPTLSVVQSGVILDVEGTVSADRRYVTLTVRPSLATLVEDPPRQIVQEAFFQSADNVDPILTRAVIEAPELELTTVRTSVSVPDRGTLMLGGQRIVAETEIEAGVPVLSKIPVLNRLFTNRSTVKDERTLLILIKPTIIIQSEEEEQFFPGLLQSPEQYEAG